MTGNVSLPNVAEETAAPAGSALNGLSISSSDVDGTVTGYAVAANAANATTQGTWQYSTDGTTWAAIGTVDDAAGALALSAATQLRFVPAENYAGTPPALTIRAIDSTYGGAFSSTNGGTETRQTIDVSTNGASSAVSSGTGTIGLTVTPVNDAPTANPAFGYVNAGVSTETGELVTITDTNLHEGDPDDDGAGVTYTVTTATANGTLFLDANSNGIIDGGEAIALNGTFTQANIDAGLIKYEHGGGAGASDSFVFSVADGLEDSAAPLTGLTFAITVAARPVVTIGGGAPAHVEDAGATVVAPNLTLTDADSANLAGATVTITDFVPGDALNFTNSGGITGSLNGSGVLTLTGSASVADYQAALRSITYSTTNDNPATGVGNGDRVISFTVTDGALQSVAGTSQTVTVANANDAPELDASQSPALTNVGEDAAAPVGAAGTLVSALVGGMTDVDTGAVQGIAITATSSLGTLWYSIDAGTTWTQAPAVSASAALLLQGNARVYFQPSTDVNGAIPNALTFRAWDRTTGTNGGTADTTTNGGGTAFSTATDLVSVTVDAVNDAPDLTVPATIAVTEGVATALTGITVSDIDAGLGSVTVTLGVPSGTLAATTGSGVTVGGTPTALTLSGTVTAINAFIAASNVRFTTDPAVSTDVTLTVAVDDGGNTGSGGTLGDNGTVTLDVSPPPPPGGGGGGGGGGAPPPATGTIDGATVATTTTTGPDGAPQTQVVVTPTASTRVEDPQTPASDLADIPIGPGEGTAALRAGLPTGAGLVVEGKPGALTPQAGLADLLARIGDDVPAGAERDAMNAAAGRYTASLSGEAPLVVRTVTPTVAQGTTSLPEPILIAGGAGTGAPEALVIDVSGLPSGTVITLSDVDFAVIVGAVTVQGGAGPNVVFGDDAAQVIVLGEDDDVLNGGGGDDTIGSAGGNDRITGGMGDDTLFGGDGTDFAYYSGARADHVVTRGADGLANAVSGPEGADTLATIERLVFSDGVIAFDLSPITDPIYRLYAAAFGRTPDQGGFEFWIDRALTGQGTLIEFARYFVVSPEYTALYGPVATLPDTTFVDTLYQNILSREGEAEGRAFWLGRLADGMERAHVLASFTESAENVANNAEVLAQGVLLSEATFG
ncbi:DUF4214 domain-containing protein [Salinarimonas ramus]|uniref:DUF4214 domain-containing protein n=1 Tax=Salinarimonas ramus TaxID=690164 RepID=UPI0016641CB3|nr:DUF4214 domain-containing protein [Salinarimonas ramus]